MLARKKIDLHTIMATKELLQLPSVLSVHDYRNLMNDYTVIHGSHLYQVDPKQPALVKIGDRLNVQTRRSGKIFIVKGNSELKFTEIPERPKKAVVTKTEDGRRFGHKPKAEHPWKYKQQKALSLNKVLA